VETPPSVGAVIGENLRRLREHSGLTQHEVARQLLRVGLTWTRSKIAAIEAGERPNLTFAEVVQLALGFDVDLAELFEGTGAVQMTQVAMPRALVREVLRGEWASGGKPDLWDPTARRQDLLDRAQLSDELRRMLAGAGETDQTLAERLGVPLEAVTDAAHTLWGRTLTEERDRRASELGEMDVRERKAHRGHLTRELSQRIETELRTRGLLHDTEGVRKEE
jgi:transcriptional regulator with XRE-family HTH domain